MNNLLKIILLICGTWLLSYNFDWRFSFILPFLVILAVAHRNPIVDLIIGFVSVFLVWLTASLIIDGGNKSILSTRLAHMFGMAHGATLVVISGFLGGVIGGLGALSGHFLKKSITRSNDPVT